MSSGYPWQDSPRASVPDEAQRPAPDEGSVQDRHQSSLVCTPALNPMEPLIDAPSLLLTPALTALGEALKPLAPLKSYADFPKNAQWIDNTIRQVLPTSKGVEVCKRTGPGGKEVYIVLNHTNVEQKIHFPWRAKLAISL